LKKIIQHLHVKGIQQQRNTQMKRSKMPLLVLFAAFLLLGLMSAPSLASFYDFETGAQGWTVGVDPDTSYPYFRIPSIAPTWTLDTSLPGNVGQDLPSTWWTNPNYGQLGPERSHVTSPVLTATGSSVSINFDSYTSNEDGYPTLFDVEHVQISINGGQFTDVHGYTSELHNLYDRIFRNITFTTNTDVSAGDLIEYRFLYDTGDGCCGSSDVHSWAFDNVLVIGASEDKPMTLDTEKAKVCWQHNDLHLEGRMYFPEGVWKDTLSPTGSAEITLAGVGVTNQTLDFKIKGKKEEKWEYKAKKNVYGNIKEFKIDWKEKAPKFDYKGDLHIHTHSIADNETTLCIHSGHVSGAFTVSIDGTEIAFDWYRNIDTILAYESQKADNSHVHFTLPFQLTPDMTIEVAGEEELCLNVADYYEKSYAKFKLVSSFNPHDFDGTTSLPDELEFNITLRDDTNEVSGEDLIGVQKVWTKQDDKHWEYKPKK